jgi:hypothetical protein
MEAQTQKDAPLKEDTDEWVECVACSKWRVLPRGVDATTLPDDWICSSGTGWRTTGLNCDVEDDVTNEEEVIHDDNACHQPLVGSYRVKLMPVVLNPEEEKWLRLVWGLRPCYTWNDGYSAYRCAAANRGSTKQHMIDEILYYWGYKWTKGAYGTANAYQNAQPYKHTDVAGDTHQMEFSVDLAHRNIESLRPVQDALHYSKKFHLNKRYVSPETFFESLAIIDSMCILLINTMSDKHAPRYRVYNEEGSIEFNNMQDVSRYMSETKRHNVKIRGLAFRNLQFCSLFPVHEQPNFAGDGAIEPFS